MFDFRVVEADAIQFAEALISAGEQGPTFDALKEQLALAVGPDVECYGFSGQRVMTRPLDRGFVVEGRFLYSDECAMH